MVSICLDKSPHQINSLWADFSKQMGTICLGQTTRPTQTGNAPNRLGWTMFSLVAAGLRGTPAAGWHLGPADRPSAGKGRPYWAAAPVSGCLPPQRLAT